MLILFATLFSTGCAGRKNLPLGEVPNLTPPDSSKSIQTKAYIEGRLAQSAKVLSISAPESKRAIRIVRRLKDAAGGRAVELPVYVIDAGPEMVNALAVNGSAIIVFKALLDKISDDNQIAAILAHELGHLSGKHAEDKGEESRSRWVNIGSSILGVAAAVAVAAAGGNSASVRNAGDLAQGISRSVGTGGIVKAYSREMENEADQIGIVLMARAGYRPEAAVELWKNAEKILGDQSAKHTTFWSTHPSSEDRFAKLDAALPYARSEFREQTFEQIQYAKQEDAKLERLGTDTRKAQEFYEKAMAQIRAGNSKASLQPLKKYLSYAEQYGWESVDVQFARQNLSLIEHSQPGQSPDVITPEEVAVLQKIKIWYINNSLSPAQAESLVETFKVSTRGLNPSQRLGSYLSTLNQLNAQR